MHPFHNHRFMMFVKRISPRLYAWFMYLNWKRIERVLSKFPKNNGDR